MSIAEVKQLVGKDCRINWTDKTGHTCRDRVLVIGVQDVPCYGAYIIVDFEEIRLDRIMDITAMS